MSKYFARSILCFIGLLCTTSTFLTSCSPSDLPENDLSKDAADSVASGTGLLPEDVTLPGLSKELDAAKIALDDLTEIPISFLQKHLANWRFEDSSDPEFNLEFPSSYRFYEYEKRNRYQLLTFFYSDEFCCNTLYAASFSVDQDSLIGVIRLAYSGGDGGWSGNRSYQRMTDSTFKTFEVSSYDEDLDEQEKNNETDSIWTTIRMDQNGHFTETVDRHLYYKNQVLQSEKH